MRKRIVSVILGAFLLAGCMSVRESTAIREEAVKKGITVVAKLPKELPDGVNPLPGTHYVLVSAESGAAAAVSLVVPIPFVTDVAMAELNKREAGRYDAAYASVDPYAIATERMKGSPLLGTGSDALEMMPFVYIVEGSDGIFRLSLVFRVEGGDWMGRYMYHLPITYKGDRVHHPRPEDLDKLRQELVAGADVLRNLMEREARGELKSTGAKVDIGSYFLVGSNVSGIVPAGALHYPNNDLLEETDDHVIVRARGDLKAQGNAGGLVFGVHYFRKDQLHTFKLGDEKK